MIWKLLPSVKGSQKDGKEYRTKKINKNKHALALIYDLQAQSEDRMSEQYFCWSEFVN